MTPPAAIARMRASRRSEPATISISPAATSSAPMRSEEMLFARRKQRRADAEQDDRDARRAQSARAVPAVCRRLCLARQEHLDRFARDSNHARRRLVPISGCDHPQRPLADPVIERWLDAHHLAVERDRERGAAGCRRAAARRRPGVTMSSLRVRLNSARMLAAIRPQRLFLRITRTHSSAVVETSPARPPRRCRGGNHCCPRTAMACRRGPSRR